MAASGLLRKGGEELGLLAHRLSDTACCVGQEGSVGGSLCVCSICWSFPVARTDFWLFIVSM